MQPRSPPEILGLARGTTISSNGRSPGKRPVAPRQRESRETFKRIAICTVGELFGGVERHVLGVVDGLATHGVGALLILFHDGELAAQARMLGINPLILPNRNVAIIATSRHLARILEQRSIEVVHVHGYKATVFCALARRWYLFAMVKTEHGLPEPTAGGRVRMWRNRLYHLLDTFATRAAHATVCYVTDDLRRHYRKTHPDLHTVVIPNGVSNMDPKQFPRPPEMHEDWFNLVIVGRLDLVKGHHLAIDSLAARGVSSSTHLHILGAGPSEQELRALAKARGIEHRVHILGFQRNIYNYIAHCSVLIMPSLHEGLPYTLLEAMALGVPIIASRVGGLAEVISDRGTGLLIEPGDAVALGDAIRRLESDSALCAKLGERAQRLQREQYALETMTERYLKVYHQALLGIS